jgi:hypothetical protein
MRKHAGELRVGDTGRYAGRTVLCAAIVSLQSRRVWLRSP